MAGHWIGLTRLAVFGTASVFAVIVLGLAADWISVTETDLGYYFAYVALAIATAVLTIVTVPAMLVIDFFRRGVLTSMILVEIVWLGILWVLWLATAAYSANQYDGISAACQSVFAPSWLTTGCSETQAIAAFSFLTWIALLGYWIALLTISAISATRGTPNVWYTSVKEATFAPSTAKVDLTGAMGTAEHKGSTAPAPVGYPAVPQPMGQAQPGYQPTQM